MTETPKHILDAEKLTRTQLRQKYSLTYNSWRNMKQRCKGGGYKLHPDFEDFVCFLKCMGPRPAQDLTLDRIDPANPEYSPDNCRWAGKALQAVNKTNTVYLTSSEGVTLPLTEWAKKLRVNPKTLYERRSRGCSDHEVLYGKVRTNGGHKFSCHPDWAMLLSPSVNPKKLEEAYRRGRKSESVSRASWLIDEYVERIPKLREQIANAMDKDGKAPDHLQREYDNWEAACKRAEQLIRQRRCRLAQAANLSLR